MMDFVDHTTEYPEEQYRVGNLLKAAGQPTSGSWAGNPPETARPDTGWYECTLFWHNLFRLGQMILVPQPLLGGLPDECLKLQEGLRMNWVKSSWVMGNPFRPAVRQMLSEVIGK